MKNHNLLATAGLIVAAAGCSTTTVSQPPPATTDAAAATVQPDTAVSHGSDDHASGATAGPSTTCLADQFVACRDGEDCRRRRTEFVHPKRCHDRAAAACAAAACDHGCDIYRTEIGGPKMVLCAPNAASTGNMEVCGGIANWACPEGMRCQLPSAAATALDATGRCVAETG